MKIRNDAFSYVVFFHYIIIGKTNGLFNLLQLELVRNPYFVTRDAIRLLTGRNAMQNKVLTNYSFRYFILDKGSIFTLRSRTITNY